MIFGDGNEGVFPLFGFISSCKMPDCRKNVNMSNRPCNDKRKGGKMQTATLQRSLQEKRMSHIP